MAGSERYKIQFEAFTKVHDHSRDVNSRYNCLRTALGMLKQKQEVATISIDIIEAPDHPSYHTLDNLHK